MFLNSYHKITKDKPHNHSLEIWRFNWPIAPSALKYRIEPLTYSKIYHWRLEGSKLHTLFPPLQMKTHFASEGIWRIWYTTFPDNYSVWNASHRQMRWKFKDCWLRGRTGVWTVSVCLYVYQRQEKAVRTKISGT